jgi:hypothetical protein
MATVSTASACLENVGEGVWTHYARALGTQQVILCYDALCVRDE